MITGARGLVGRAVVECCTAEGESVAAFDHKTLDITDQLALNSAFEATEPDVLINCAAWTDVDGCELDRERAMKVNSRGPELLALACRQTDTLLITISTDYVFDGKKVGFYTQRDPRNPQSIYAVSKLEGERCAQKAWVRTIIVRSGYIFGAGGRNFLSTVVERARRGEHLAVITDSFGTPTYAPDLARRLHRLAQLDLPGIFHVVNAGDGASFEDFARRALATAGLDHSLLHGVTLESLKRPAARPRNSRLRCLVSEAIGLEPLPFWQEALREFIGEPRTERLISAAG
jgi:dTDP-4-dehydrorhamnose reductase